MAGRIKCDNAVVACIRHVNFSAAFVDGDIVWLSQLAVTASRRAPVRGESIEPDRGERLSGNGILTISVAGNQAVIVIRPGGEPGNFGVDVHRFRKGLTLGARCLVSKGFARSVFEVAFGHFAPTRRVDLTA